MPYGATVVYGEYGKNEDKFSNAQWVAGVTGSELTQWGVGLVQEIDAAAMSLYLNYRHYEANATCTTNALSFCAANGLVVNGKTSFDDADLIKAGAIINF